MGEAVTWKVWAPTPQAPLDWVTVRVALRLSPTGMSRLMGDQAAHAGGVVVWNTTRALSFPELVTLTSYVATVPPDE
jgi:hypothetical protein